MDLERSCEEAVFGYRSVKDSVAKVRSFEDEELMELSSVWSLFECSTIGSVFEKTSESNRGVRKLIVDW